MAPPPNFKPALIIVDLQEDFCPPNGSLAVPNGRSIIPTVNTLLTLPFPLKIATKDWHPLDHISFAANHPSAEPFTSYTTITNPSNASETYTSRLWPVHCVQNTPGASLVSELDVSKIDKVIEKGTIRDVEMYSAFYTPLKDPRVGDSGLAGVLREGGISDVFVVGLAFDYCVASTAVDAKAEGFTTWVVREGTRLVDASQWAETEKELEGKGVSCVDFEGSEVGWVREYKG
ncbi:Isochorismatase hydrolase [Mollisia scopiformis]|uniref:nicotinamidase n=1 Tax=Mollisia scopiformis TaxID=149040 RepID=A0A194XW98_MOLSC|nr:Isochorismatase hydrolase [Mollisia scopiformis]KUJ24289.1 Isochorismatase hydrolase [Mollisia scopiformis]